MAKPRPLQWIVGAAIAVLLALGVWFIHGIATTEPEPTRKVVQEVQIIRPPPPPPDQPPPPPPPPKPEDVAPEPEEAPPDPTPSNEPPPGEQLGVDADGAGAGDGFGLVGRKGGRDLLASGGSAFAWYAGQLKNELLEALGNEQKIRSGSYSIVVRLWLKDDGSIEKIVLAGSSGDTTRDKLIESTLSRLTRLSQPPPAGMPQPVSIRIVSRA